MNDPREDRSLETPHGVVPPRPDRFVGPLPPNVVVYTWNLLLSQGVGLDRLGAYAVTAQGRTVYLPGPHGREGPRGLSVRQGRVSLDGTDERGQRTLLPHLIPASVDLYLCVSGD
ncbi:hypothetical protein [Deinococcus planocerae]|uniref:hypothetical protein n=1 Tax=Deinococcus planocerae TaxID=1737569 RepID=UPI000C7ED39F|nr:hypothetical protein [Deinococcus planocerae]